MSTLTKSSYEQHLLKNNLDYADKLKDLLLNKKQAIIDGCYNNNNKKILFKGLVAIKAHEIKEEELYNYKNLDSLFNKKILIDIEKSYDLSNFLQNKNINEKIFYFKLKNIVKENQLYTNKENFGTIFEFIFVLLFLEHVFQSKEIIEKAIEAIKNQNTTINLIYCNKEITISFNCKWHKEIIVNFFEKNRNFESLYENKKLNHLMKNAKEMIKNMFNNVSNIQKIKIVLKGLDNKNLEKTDLEIVINEKIYRFSLKSDSLLLESSSPYKINCFLSSLTNIKIDHNTRNKLTHINIFTNKLLPQIQNRTYNDKKTIKKILDTLSNLLLKKERPAILFIKYNKIITEKNLKDLYKSIQSIQFKTNRKNIIYLYATTNNQETKSLIVLRARNDNVKRISIQLHRNSLLYNK